MFGQLAGSPSVTLVQRPNAGVEQVYIKNAPNRLTNDINEKL
jgi:hypothetical protein